jgi:hypothetical protein
VFFMVFSPFSYGCEYLLLMMIGYHLLFRLSVNLVTQQANIPKT